MKKKFPAVIGLRNATLDEIEELKKKHPFGSHKTHLNNGSKLPYNGVFYTQKPLYK